MEAGLMEERVYPRIKNAIILCLLLLAAQLVLGIPLVVIQLLLDPPEMITGIINIFISIVSAGLILLLGFKKAKRKFNDVFKFNRVSPFLWAATAVFSIGMIVVSSELDNLLNFFLPIPEIFRKAFENLAGQKVFAISIIYMGILPAITEEMFFRGLILDGFARNYSKRKAVFISALLFGLIHLNPWQFLTAFMIGLAAAWICIETNSILPCMLIHFINNTLYTVMVRLEDFVPIRGFNAITSGVHEFQPLWFTLPGLAVFAAGIMMLMKGMKKPAPESAPAASPMAIESEAENTSENI